MHWLGHLSTPCRHRQWGDGAGGRAGRGCPCGIHSVLGNPRRAGFLPHVVSGGVGETSALPCPWCLFHACCHANEMMSSQGRRLDPHPLMSLVVSRCASMLNERLNEAFVCLADGPNPSWGWALVLDAG